MIRTRWIQVLGSLSVVAALAGCSTSSSGPDASEKDDVVSEEEARQPDDSTVQQAPNDGDTHGRRDRKEFGGLRGGPLQMLRKSLDGVDLTADQKSAIDKAFDDARPAGPQGDADKGEAFKAFFGEVAKEIRDNRIDEAGLIAKASSLEKPAAGDPMHAGMAKVLQVVHDTLTAEQRAKLASDLAAKFEGMGARFAGRGEKFGKGGGEHGGLGFLLHGVDVSDTQRDAIEKALDEAGLHGPREAMKQGAEEMQTKMKALFEAFKGDRFDAASALPAPPAMKGDHLETMIRSLKIVVPLLDDGQRAALADRIEKGPEMMGKHGPRGEKHGKAGERHARRGAAEETFD